MKKAIQGVLSYNSIFITGFSRCWHQLAIDAHKKTTFFIFMLLFYVTSIHAQPCLPNWSYRCPVEITNPSNPELSSFQVYITFNSMDLVNAGKMKVDGSDIRFTDTTGAALEYWIENGSMYTSNTRVWIKVNTIDAYGLTTIYMFYGNNDAIALSSGVNTFVMFDDFTCFDETKWEHHGSGTYSVSGGKLTLQSGSGSGECSMLSTETMYQTPYISEMYVSDLSLSSSTKAFISQQKGDFEGYSFLFNRETDPTDYMQLASINTENCPVHTTFQDNINPNGIPDADIWGFTWFQYSGVNGYLWDGTVDALNTTQTSHTWSSGFHTWLGVYDDAGTMQINWFRIRKYATGEVSAALGAEVTTPVTGSFNATSNSPICEGGNLQFGADNITGATYCWKAPNSSTCFDNIPNPVINLATPSNSGTYTLVVSVPGAGCSYSEDIPVVVNPTTVAGTITGATNVCSGNNNGQLILTGFTGQVQRWEYSLSGGEPWAIIDNTSNIQSYTDITQTTWFRAVVRSGDCLQLKTSAVAVTVDEVSVGGTVTADEDICIGESVTLTLTENTGDIDAWQYSTDGVNFTSTSYSGNPQVFTPGDTICYRASVSNGSCDAATSNTIQINVNPTSVGGSFEGAAVCSNASGTLELQGHTGEVVQWEISQTGGSPWTVIENTTSLLNYDNITTTTFYRTVVQSPGCDIDYSAIDTVIVDEPAIGGAILGSDTICYGANDVLLTASGYNGRVIDWERSYDGSSWTPLTKTTDTIWVHNLTQKTWFHAVVAGTHGRCDQVTSAPAVLWISPRSVGGEIAGSASVCSNGNEGVLKLKYQTGNVVRWERSNSGQEPWFIIANTNDSLVYQNLYETTCYRAIVKTYACPEVHSDSARIRVSQMSDAGTITGATAVCEANNMGSLVLTNYTGEILKWQYKDQNDWGTVSTVVPDRLDYLNLDDTTYYRAIVRNGSACLSDTSAISTIIVYPMPDVDFIADPVNEGQSTYFYDASTIVSGTMVGYDWNFDNGSGSIAQNPVYTYSDPGTYDVRLRVTSNKGCYDEATKEVVVYAMPHVQFEFKNVCRGNNMDFVNKSTIRDGVVIYEWDFGDGSTLADTNVSHYYVAPGIYDVKLTAITAYNRDSMVKQVAVYPRAVPDFSFSSVCEDVSMNFINQSAISDGALTYYWNFGDGHTSTGLNPSNTYLIRGDYDVTLITTSDKSCKDTIIRSVRVHPVPIPSFYAEDVPYNTPAEFYDSSTIVQGSIVQWHWNFGDANTTSVQHPQYTYTAPGNYEVTLEVVSDSGCIAETSQLIEIFPLPVAAFTFEDVCLEDSMYFINNSSIAAGKIFYTWDFGDSLTSSSQDPVHLYGNPGQYTVALYVVSDVGSRDTIMKNVIVYPRPAPDFNAPGVCDGYPVQFENISTIITGGISSYSWDFGDGSNSIQFSPQKQYLNPGTYQVKLTANSDYGCTRSITKPAIVQVLPIANFNAQHECFGYPIRFNNTSDIVDGTLTCQWDMGDLSSSVLESPVYYYNYPGIYKVKLKVQSEFNCMDSISRYVEVYELPPADAGKDTTVCRGFPIKLLATGGQWYDWSPSEGLDNPAVPDPITRPLETQTYTVRVLDQNNCENWDTVTVFVNEEFKVIATNVITPDADGVNDVWRITNIDFYEDATIHVFNRWGHEVYTVTNYQNNWDGRTNNGDILPDGTYYYVIRFATSDKYYSGAITILRNK